MPAPTLLYLGRVARRICSARGDPDIPSLWSSLRQGAPTPVNNTTFTTNILTVSVSWIILTSRWITHGVCSSDYGRKHCAESSGAHTIIFPQVARRSVALPPGTSTRDYFDTTETLTVRFRKVTVLILSVAVNWILSSCTSCPSKCSLELNPNPTSICTHTIYSILMLFNRFQNTGVTLNNSFSNIIIPSQRLETMSVSLHTQTVLHCLIIQVLNIKSLLPECLIQSFHFCT